MFVSNKTNDTFSVVFSSPIFSPKGIKNTKICIYRKIIK